MIRLKTAVLLGLCSEKWVQYLLELEETDAAKTL